MAYHIALVMYKDSEGSVMQVIKLSGRQATTQVVITVGVEKCDNKNKAI